MHQSLQTNGKWSQKESLQHINYLELKASFLALKTFLKGKSRVTVPLQLDNTTTIGYINNKGGSRAPQLMTLALGMWDWCQTIRDIFVIVSHIPGRDSVSADKESRELKDMSPTIIQPLLLNCQTDLSPSRLTPTLEPSTQTPKVTYPYILRNYAQSKAFLLVVTFRPLRVLRDSATYLHLIE